MNRMKQLALTALATLTIAAGAGTASSAAQQIAGQRVEVEDFSSVRAALMGGIGRSAQINLKENPEPDTGVQLAGARRSAVRTDVIVF